MQTPFLVRLSLMPGGCVALFAGVARALLAAGSYPWLRVARARRIGGSILA